MKTITLKEAAKTPLEKMQDANAGRRRQNWAACSDSKLLDYYKLCLAHSLTTAAGQAEQELINRHFDHLCAPRMYKIIGFNAQQAQWLWDNRDYPIAVLTAGKDSLRNSGGVLRPSEHHLRMLVLAYAINRPELDTVIKTLKDYIKKYCDTYNRFVPQYLSWVANDDDTMDIVAQAVSGVNFN